VLAVTAKEHHKGKAAAVQEVDTVAAAVAGMWEVSIDSLVFEVENRCPVVGSRIVVEGCRMRQLFGVAVVGEYSQLEEPSEGKPD
jgi:hypothetical protein